MVDKCIIGRAAPQIDVRRGDNYKTIGEKGEDE